jgi:hypothetical protein
MYVNIICSWEFFFGGGGRGGGCVDMEKTSELLYLEYKVLRSVK